MLEIAAITLDNRAQAARGSLQKTLARASPSRVLLLAELCVWRQTGWPCQPSPENGILARLRLLESSQVFADVQRKLMSPGAD